MKRLLRNVGWLVSSRGVNAACSLLYLALATRSLGLVGFGTFSLIVVLAQWLSGTASFSTWQTVVRWGSREDAASQATGFAVALDLASIAGGALAAALVTWTAALWLPLPPELRLAAFLLCLASLAAIRSTPTGILRLHDRFDLATLAEAAQPVTRAAGAVLAAWLAPTIAGFVAAWACAELACAALHWWLALRLTRFRLADVSLRRFPAGHAGVWRFVWATHLSRSLAVSARQMLLLLIGAVGGAALAGGYRVAAQLGQALVQLGEAVSRAAYPEFVNRSGQAGALAGRVAVIALATGAMAVAFAGLAGHWALTTIAGPEYGFAHPAMVILALAGAIELLGAGCEALLLARGRAWLALGLRAIPLAAALILLEPAITRFGLAGAAAGALLASALTVTGFAYAATSRRTPTGVESLEPRGTSR